MSTIIFINEVDSTNSYATNLIKQYKPVEGTVVITANQTSGKGMMGTRWVFQPQKSFAASWIFYPDFLRINSAFYLYIFSSLAVHDFLSEKMDDGLGELKIKWPNDILINNKKICGILIENTFKSVKIKSSVIGIGINVGYSEKFREFGSLNKEILITNADLKKFAQELDDKLRYYYSLLKNNKTDDLNKMYHQKLKDFNSSIVFSENANGILIHGIQRGVDDSGRLKIQVGENIKYYSTKEIKFL